jgi:hypothetical protein
MSFDLGFWHEDRPITVQQAAKVYGQLCEGNAAVVTQHPALALFLHDLTQHYPPIGSYADEEQEHARCPWSCAWDLTPGSAIVCMRWSYAQELTSRLLQMASTYGLVCYNPQRDEVYLPAARDGEMDRAARMRAALETLVDAQSEGGFVIFEDRATKDYVQFAVELFFREGDDLPVHRRLPLTADPSVPKAQMEVTARGVRGNGPPPGSSALSPAQDTAIRARGFAFHRGPNYTMVINLADLDAVVDECEHLFMILGSSPTFELGVECGT